MQIHANERDLGSVVIITGKGVNSISTQWELTR
jgi:hypothetical protein